MKIKHPDKPDLWSIGHYLIGGFAGLFYLWHPLAGCLALALAIAWEFVENTLTEKGIEKLWFIPLDPGGISFLDILCDISGFMVIIYILL